MLRLAKFLCVLLLIVILIHALRWWFLGAALIVASVVLYRIGVRRFRTDTCQTENEESNR